MTRVIVIGDLMTDAVARAESPLIKGTDTPASVTMHGGGAGANIASWIAAEGFEASFVGRRGTDIAGRNRDMELMGYGVDARLVMDPDRPTGTCVVLVLHTGDRTMLSDPGANAALSPDDLPKDLFTVGAHLHISGYTFLNDGSREAALAALHLAGRERMSVSVDGASVAPLRHAGADAFFNWTAGVKLLFANTDEAKVLTEHDDPEEAARELTRHYPQAVITLASEGALWYESGGRTPIRTPAEPLDEITDGTGAGDAFCAGFIPPWLEGKPPADALSAGCRLAARALGQVGARPAL
ncbi:MAG: carbohydrate kinase family protein [Streptosporangiaceae bacterium]